MSRESERLFQVMTHLDDGKIDEAATWQDAPKQKPYWMRWMAAAAGVVLVVGVATGRIPLSSLGGSSGGMGTNPQPGQSASSFMSYAGPVLPLTLKEENSAITAQRDITLDFAPWVPKWISNQEEADSRTELSLEQREQVRRDYDQWYPEGGRYQTSTDILVEDSYVLSNSSSQEQTLSILYPYVGSLNDEEKLVPTLSVDGSQIETTLQAGGYTGGFGQGNISNAKSWQDYRDILSDDSYLEQALQAYPDLSDVPVTVYTFMGAWGPQVSDETPNPTIRVNFDVDYDKTTVLSYNFHMGAYDEEKGTMGQGFSIPQEGSYDTYYLIVVGEDIRNIEIQGYATGGWDTKEKIDAGVTMKREEQKLDAMLRDITQLLYRNRQIMYSESSLMDVDYEMYHGLFCEYLLQYGVLSDQPEARYDHGWLGDTDFDSVDRVLYLQADITVPAQSTATLTATMTKEGSYDFHCTNTKNRGVYGYDLATTLGSNLAYTSQRVTLEDRGCLDLVRQNFGFDLEQGIHTVELDLGREHYYLEVRALKPED